MNPVPTLPENAPFNPAQRAWLNGFFAGLMGGEGPDGPGDQAARAPASPAAREPQAAAEAPALTWRDVDDEDVEYGWHDPALAMDERLALAEDQPLEFRLMAAMAQLDCGACGYLCRSYSKAIADGEEADLGKCVPGGSETARKLKTLMKEAGEAGPGAGAGSAPGGAEAAPGAAPHAPDAGAETGPPAYSRDRPFPAPALAVERLTTAHSAKDVRFVSLGIAGSGLEYRAGDSLGIYPKNCYAAVDALVRLTGFGGGELVPLSDGRTLTLREALITWCDIDNPADAFYERLAARASAGDAERLEQAASGEPVEGLVESPRVIDVLARFPEPRLEPAELIQALGRLQPRLYSIASSPRRYPDEIHLCVGVVRYVQGGQARQGVASTFLADRLASHEPVPVFLHPARDFGLPDDGDADLVMIGPGTGVAPFRAFLQEREARAAGGRNWLFFGEQHEASDFLFADELRRYHQSGLLDRLTTAFSRDQPEKIYVQHRILEHGAELWRWLEDGAHLRVCGDAARMARDVDQALHEVAREHGALSESAAAAYLKRLASEGRYQRDVY